MHHRERCAHRARRIFALGASLAGLILVSATSVAQTPVTVAGTMPSQMSVTPSGAFSYRIPLQVPPGAGGLEPKLEIAYSGHGANGALGVGWSIQGLSIITRCPRTKVHDGVKGALRLDDNDRYCLDGKRLLLVSGTYGQPNAEYRTEFDAFTKVVSLGRAGSGPSSFKAWTKAGQVMEFGNTADSKIEPIAAPGTTAPWVSGTVRDWAINKISDTKGNFLTVSYTEDSVNGDYQPLRIDYAGNAAAGTAPHSSVRFVYEAHPKAIARYRAGAVSKTVSRISEIGVFHGASTLVSKTKLTYETAGFMQASRLSAATICDASQNCMPPLSFTYPAAAGSFSTTATPWPLPSGSTSPLLGVPTQSHAYSFDDINEYGAPGVPRARSQTQVGLMDLNGDGLADLYITTFMPGGQGYPATVVPGKVFLNTGNGFAPTATPWPLPSDVKAPRDAVQGFSIATLSDLNGDGLVDLYKTKGPFGGPGVVYLNTGSGFSSTETAWPLPVGISNAEETSIVNGVTRIALVDLDGDGLPDIYKTDNTAAAVVHLNTGSGFSTTAKQWPVPSGAAPSLNNIPTSGFVYNFMDTSEFGMPDLPRPRTLTQVGLVDLNGDGLPDLYVTEYLPSCCPSPPATVIPGRVYFNTGNGFLPTATAWTLPSDIKAQRDSVNRFTLVTLVDMNGDGLPDLYRTKGPFGPGSEVPQVFFNTGTGFSAVGTPWGLPAGIANSEYISRVNYVDSVISGLVDLDGDGLPDVFKTDGINPAVVYLGSAAAVSRLSRVSSATTPAVEISYGKLTSPSIYTVDSGANAAVFPRIDLRGAQSVVSALAVDNGLGATNTVTYSYGGLKAELGAQGRGMLGFRTVKQRDTGTGVEQHVEHRLDFPYTGSLIKSETRLAGSGSSGVLKRVNTTMGCQLPLTLAACAVAVGNVYYPYVANTVEEGWDLNGAALPVVTTTYQYGQSPQFGDPTQIGVTYGDGSSKTTVNEYWPADTTNWILGRLKRATVTSVKP